MSCVKEDGLQTGSWRGYLSWGIFFRVLRSARFAVGRKAGSGRMGQALRADIDFGLSR